MPSYDNTPTFSQVLQQGFGAVNSAVNIGVQAVKEKARSDLLYMQAQFDADEHEFLMDLENSNDYPNYQKRLDDFVNKLQKSTGDKNSNYYCANEYTSLRANEMFASQKVALQNKVNEIIYKKNMQDVIANDNKTIALNRQNKDAQDAADANSAIYGYWYSNGWINKDQYVSYVENELYLIKQDKIDGYYQEGVENAISRGLTAEQYYDEIIKDHPELDQISVSVINPQYANTEAWGDNEDTATGKIEGNDEAAANTSGMTRPLLVANDKKKNDLIKKAKVQEYNAAVAAMQEQNYTKLSEMFTNMVKMENPQTKLALCRQALNVISSNMKGNRLDEAKRVSYTKLFESYIDDITKAAGKGSGTESYASYATVIKNLPDQFMAGIKDGTFNYYDAAEALQDAAAETYYSTGGVWNETKTFKDDKDRKDKFYLDNYSKVGVTEILNSKELLNAFNNEPTYKGVAAKYNALKKEVEKDLAIKDPKKRKYGEDALGTLLSFAVDFVAESGNKVLTEDDLKTFDSMLNGVNLSWLDKNIKGFNNNSDKGILQTIDITQNNDFLFTDINGNERWASPQAKEKMDQAAETLKPVLAEILGVSEKDLGDHSYMNTKYDKNNVPEWTIEGKRYHLEKTKDGKSYQAVDDNGNVYKSQTVAEKRAADRKAKREAAAKKREMSAKDKQLLRDREKDFYGMTYDDFVNTVNSSELSDEKKQQLLEEFATREIWNDNGAWSKVLAFEDAGYYSK